MRRRLVSFFASLSKRLEPKPVPLDQSSTIRVLSEALNDAATREQAQRADYIERCTELIEARQMSGSGPWLVHESREAIGKPGKFRESNPLLSQGAFGDLDLMLSNLEWKRETNLSWMEFSRWGIQQIILISRLYFIKNPIIRRLIDIAALYVFARGVEVSSSDETANSVLEEFFERNKSVLGQNALVDLEKAKYTDGNLFFAFFSDTINKGLVSVRTIDATEIMDIVTDPDDTNKPWFYRRVWTQRVFDPLTGASPTQRSEAWYPALDYEPEVKPEMINGFAVMWDNPVLHRKCGGVAKWLWGCPIIYPALDWAKAARKFLEACATVKQALAQIAMTLTTKGGQQALEGAKLQLQTNVGPPNPLWDTNPSANAGSTFASGPGTKLEVFKTGGAGGNPDEVRQYKLMCCMVVGVPESFLADMNTSNLATATSLDRPTELCFMEKQEAWREDLVTMARYVLRVSSGAPSGRLKESLQKRDMDTDSLIIREAPRAQTKDGRWVYKETKVATAGTIEIRANFPAILESDIPALITSTVDAMTLGNRGGQVVGIDEKEGVRKLYDYVGIENGDEIVEKQYPDGEYDPDRTKEILPDPIPPHVPGGAPKLNPDGSSARAQMNPTEASLARLGESLRLWKRKKGSRVEHVRT